MDKVEIPAKGSEERDFWLEAAEQHGFREDPTVEGLYTADAGTVLKLMAAARQQGRDDLVKTEPPRTDQVDKVQAYLTELSDLGRKYGLGLQPSQHKDGTMVLYHFMPEDTQFNYEARGSKVRLGEWPNETNEERLERINRQLKEHGGVDSDDLEWMSEMTEAFLKLAG